MSMILKPKSEDYILESKWNFACCLLSTCVGASNFFFLANKEIGFHVREVAWDEAHILCVYVRARLNLCVSYQYPLLRSLAVDGSKFVSEAFIGAHYVCYAYMVVMFLDGLWAPIWSLDFYIATSSRTYAAHSNYGNVNAKFSLEHWFSVFALLCQPIPILAFPVYRRIMATAARERERYRQIERIWTKNGKLHLV